MSNPTKVVLLRVTDDGLGDRRGQKVEVIGARALTAMCPWWRKRVFGTGRPKVGVYSLAFKLVPLKKPKRRTRQAGG